MFKKQFVFLNAYFVKGLTENR